MGTEQISQYASNFGIYTEKLNQGDGFNNEALRNSFFYLVVRVIEERKQKNLGKILTDNGWDTMLFGVYDSLYSAYIEGGKTINIPFVNTSFTFPTIRNTTIIDEKNHIITEIEYILEKLGYVWVMAAISGEIIPGAKRMTWAELRRYSYAYFLRALVGILNNEGWDKYMMNPLPPQKNPKVGYGKPPVSTWEDEPKKEVISGLAAVPLEPDPMEKSKK